MTGRTLQIGLDQNPVVGGIVHQQDFQSGQYFRERRSRHGGGFQSRGLRFADGRGDGVQQAGAIDRLREVPRQTQFPGPGQIATPVVGGKQNDLHVRHAQRFHDVFRNLESVLARSGVVK